MEDVEMMVNNPKRQRAIKRTYKREEARRQERPLNDALIFAFCGLLLFILGTFEMVKPIIAICGGLISLMGGSFNIGRFFENVKCNGWL